MSGETERDVSGWTTDTLKMHLDTRIDAMLTLIREGDERLREHIGNQDKQVRDAFAAVTALDNERQDALARRLDAVRRETALIQEASGKAIEKAEAATEKRFDAVNEFRSEAREVRAAQQEAIAKLVSELLPREVFDTTVTQWSQWRSAVDRDRARIVGQGEQRSESRLSTGHVLALGGFVLAVLGTLIVLANFAFSHAGAQAPTPVVTVRAP